MRPHRYLRRQDGESRQRRRLEEGELRKQQRVWSGEQLFVNGYECSVFFLREDACSEGGTHPKEAWR